MCASLVVAAAPASQRRLRCSCELAISRQFDLMGVGVHASFLVSRVWFSQQCQSVIQSVGVAPCFILSFFSWASVARAGAACFMS